MSQLLIYDLLKLIKISCFDPLPLLERLSSGSWSKQLILTSFSRGSGSNQLILIRLKIYLTYCCFYHTRKRKISEIHMTCKKEPLSQNDRLQTSTIYHGTKNVVKRENMQNIKDLHDL